MTTKKTHTIVLLAACLFAVGSTAFLLADGRQSADQLSYQCFKTTTGWGYDILHGKKIIIHQPFVPGVPGRNGFEQEHAAASVAQNVIENIKSGQMRVISQRQMQRPGVLPTQVK